MFRRNKQPADFDLSEYIGMFEYFLRDCGVDPVNQRVAWGDGVYAWSVNRGSARTFFVLFTNSGLVAVHMLAPLVYLPTDRLMPIYRKCLELNSAYLGAIAVHGNVLYLDNVLVLAGINPVYVANVYDIFTGEADELDDVLADEFGTRQASDVDDSWLLEVL